MKKVKFLKFRAPMIVEAEDSGFNVYSPAFKSLHLQGKTREEALQLGREAAKKHLEQIIQSGEPIPLDIVGFDEALNPLNEKVDYLVEEIQVDLE
jgi:predicted RNase H-like HicB family nuclease